MSNPSNLYAEKVFAEHPLSLWSLDDKVDYVSLITEAQRNIGLVWDGTGGGSSPVSTPVNEPFPDSWTTILYGDPPTVDGEELIAWSPDLKNFTDLNKDLGTVCVGTYFYVDSVYIKTISIGIEYTDTTSLEVIRKIKTFDDPVYATWSLMSATFDIPNENVNFRLFVKFSKLTGGANTDDYQILFNGLTVGQWSEEFNATSLGITLDQVPTTISIPSTKGKATSSYGVDGDYAYYLSSEGTLCAKNSAFPLVFGSSNSTVLSPGLDGAPSLIIPGKGFLNSTGKYKDYTIEFWTRISSDSPTPKKIFGPIASADGIYVEGGFITVVVGDNFASHFVGEWFRPMLVDFKVIRDSASLLINGEEVISLSYKTEDLTLPEEYDNTGKNQDWLAFYSFDDVTPIHVDCFGIYPYSVSTIVAKRRWVYGQGVGSQENINSAYGGTSAFVDYTLADYTANYNYPDYAEWQQGTFDNLSTTTSSITTPDYSLPEIFLESKTLKNLYDDNYLIQSEDNKFFTFRPDETWNDKNCYLNFSSFNILTDELHTLYGIFKVLDSDSSNQILFKIYNSLTGNYFVISKTASDIKYYLYFNGEEQEFYSEDSFAVDQTFCVGIQINKLVNYFGGDIAAFFGNQNGLKIYVGGDELGNTFTGNIYSVGFSTNYNAEFISDHFSENGIAIFNDSTEMLAHTASYTILPLQQYDKFFLDIGVSGYWEDYIPLSYFAQYVKDTSGEEFYDIDFLQFNIGYPSPSKLTERETISSWTYEDLYLQYQNPTQLTYSHLDDVLTTGWANYEDLFQKSVKYYDYDTENANIQSHITFQYIENGSNLLDNNFVNSVNADQSRIINVDEYPDWATTKFQVVDNTIIYPSKSIDFNELAIVLHLNLNVRGILSKQLKLKKVQFASQVFNDNSFNPVGTRFGINLFPYKKSGIYYDYKSKNPFSIYKDNTPYLYMTRNSGIEVRGDSFYDRGISMPINESKASSYRVGALQLWTRYDGDKFSTQPVKIFEVDYKTNAIEFYMVADSGYAKRARIFAKDKNTGQDFTGLSYYVNGLLVREPVITRKEWTVLGVGFASDVVFDSKLGNLNLSGPMIFNNITYYQSNNLQQIQANLTRPWIKVKTSGVTNYDWQYWENNFSWNGMLVLGTFDVYGVNPGDVYRAYLGTNKTIFDDSHGLSVNPDKINIYSTLGWSTNTTSPV